MSNAAAIGRQSQHDGEVGQNIAHYTLSRLGVEMVEAVYTPWKVLFKNTSSGRKVVNAFPLRKVSGDFRGVLPGGRAVLIEVKSRTTRDTFRWSDLEDHQKDALHENSGFGGLSLVCWVNDLGECIVIEWDKFVSCLDGKSRKSITWSEAVDIQWTGI